MKNIYTFISCSPDNYNIQEEITIVDITSGCLFCAKDSDGNFIIDEDNNNVFKALSGPMVDELGPYVYCNSIGRIDGQTE